MKKKGFNFKNSRLFLVVLVTLFFCGKPLLGQGDLSSCLRLDRCSHPLKIYVGPIVVGSVCETEIQNYLVSANQCYGGITEGVEYLKPNFLFASLDIFSVFSSPVTVYQQGVKQPSPGWTEFGGFDMKLGYPFAYQEWIVSLYGALPWYSYRSISNNSGLRESFFGFGGGVYALYYSPFGLDAGLDIEFFGNSNTKRYAPYGKEDFHSWGAKFSMPLIWGLKRYSAHFETTLKPFVLVLDMKEGSFIYGASWSFDFRF